MNVGIGLCWGSAPGAALEELAGLAARNGFRAFTVKHPLFAASLRAGTTPAALQRRIRDLDVRVSVVDPLISALPGTPRPDEVEPRFREYFEISADDCLETARALEAQTINVAHFLGRSVGRALLVDAIGEFALRAGSDGFVVSVEFIPGTGIPDLAMAAGIVSDVGLRNVGVMLDTWHFARCAGTVSQLTELAPAAIAGVQLSDRREPPPGQTYVPMSDRLVPGEGELPLRAILEAVLANSPGATIDVEVFSDELASLPRPLAVRRIAAATRGVFGSH